MTTYDMKRVRTLQRDIDDARRPVKIVKWSIAGFVAINVALIAMIVLGNMFSINWVANFGFGLIPIWCITVVAVPCFLVDSNFHPFQRLKITERKLEDYYDEVGMP